MTAQLGNDGATLTALPGADFGAITQTVVVDLDRTPDLDFSVPPGSEDWVVKVNDGTRPVDVALTPMPWAGTELADVAAATGWHGVKTFQVRLFEVGRGQSVTFSDATFMGRPMLRNAPPQDAEWRPDRVMGADGSSIVVLPNNDSIAERIALSPGRPAGLFLTGRFAGNMEWDPYRNCLLLRGSGWTAALAVSVPVAWGGVRRTELAWHMPSKSLDFQANGGVWRLRLLPLPGSPVVVAARFAPSSGNTDALVSAAQRQANVAAFDTALAQNEAEANRWLARAPCPRDFMPRRVNPEGVTAAQVRRAYGQAWAALRMDTLPPMPENGFPYPQVCTGKAALWTDGATHAPETATWDSLVAMQSFALVDPEVCQQAMAGLLSLVGPDGYLNGESLPPIFAQTLWTLYAQTGDRAALGAAYPALKRHLLWMIANPRWIYPNRAEPAPDPLAPKDQEFVVYELLDIGYAVQITQVLHLPAETRVWRQQERQAQADYARWFWPQPGGPVYRIYTSDTDRSDPNDPWSLQGMALGPSRLTPAEESGLLALYTRSVNPQLPFLVPGRTRFGDLRPLMLGLRACGQPAEAAQLADACERDITRADAFSEFYTQTDPPQPQGVRPSMFGACLLIDSILWHNGEPTPVAQNLTRRASTPP